MKAEKALNEIREFRYNKLQELLDKCTEGQRGVFKRMYGTLDVYEMPDDKIDWAIQQCERTLNKWSWESNKKEQEEQ